MQSTEARDAWLQERLEHITASDLAAILGLSKYKSSNAVRKEKVERTVTEIPDLAQLKAGRFQEGGVAMWFASDHPEYSDVQEHGRLQKSPVFDRLAATPDWVAGIVPLECKVVGETGLVNWREAGREEFKAWPVELARPEWVAKQVHWTAEHLNWSDKGTLKARWRNERLDQVRMAKQLGEWCGPLNYWVQLQSQMHVLGADHGWLVAAIGGTSRVDLAYERDDAFLSWAIDQARAFWLLVEKGRSERGRT